VIHATTILAVRHKDRAVLAGDGQVTLGDTIVKQRARKVRRLYNDKILAGFAGSAADSFALFSRFEAKLEQYRGNLERSSVELAKDWRTDRALRRLEAMLVVLDRSSMFLLSGTGDLIEPDEGVIGIGSGGVYALAAAIQCHRLSDRARGVPHGQPGDCHERRLSRSRHRSARRRRDCRRHPVVLVADTPPRRFLTARNGTYITGLGSLTPHRINPPNVSLHHNSGDSASG